MVGFWFPPRSAYMYRAAAYAARDTTQRGHERACVTSGDPERACVTSGDPERACVTSPETACVTPDETEESCAARARACAEGIVRAACDVFDHGKRWEGHELPMLRAALRTIEECERLIRSLYRPQDVQAEVSAMIDERANGREDER